MTTNLDTAQLAAILKEWLGVDSTSGEEREFLEHLEAFFADDGWTIQRQEVAPNRWNLLVGDGTPAKVLFSTHVDTVPPFLPVRQEDNTVYGRGACDTKGGLVAMWAAARRLKNRGVEGIGFLLVVGEEVDHCGAKIARQLDVQPTRIILCEPTQNRVVRAQRGMIRFALRTTGVAGHSAFPNDGTSAIHRLLDGIERLRQTTWPTDDILGETTINVGVIEGGVAANIFAPTARAELLFRAVSPVEPMIERVEELLGDEIEIEDIIYNDPVFFDAPDDLESCTVPFNTDATYLAELGPVWLVGPGDIRCAHSDDERIDLNELQTGIDLYETLASRALKA